MHSLPPRCIWWPTDAPLTFLRGWQRIGDEIVDGQVALHYILCWQRNRVEKSSLAAEPGSPFDSLLSGA